MTAAARQPADKALFGIGLGLAAQFGAMMFWGGSINARLANLETLGAGALPRAEFAAHTGRDTIHERTQDERLMSAFSRINAHDTQFATLGD